MFGELEERLCSDTVTRGLSIASQPEIFVQDLLGGASYFTTRTITLEIIPAAAMSLFASTGSRTPIACIVFHLILIAWLFHHPQSTYRHATHRTAGFYQTRLAIP